MPPAHTAYDNRSGSAEMVMEHYVNNHLVNTVDCRRKIPQLVIAPDKQRGMHIDYSSRFNNKAKEMSTLSLASGLRWDVTLDIANKKWVFDVVKGRNLVAGQSINPPVNVSPQFESLKSLLALALKLHSVIVDLHYQLLYLISNISFISVISSALHIVASCSRFIVLRRLFTISLIAFGLIEVISANCFCDIPRSIRISPNFTSSIFPPPTN